MQNLVAFLLTLLRHGLQLLLLILMQSISTVRLKVYASKERKNNIQLRKVHSDFHFSEVSNSSVLYSSHFSKIQTHEYGNIYS